MSSKDFPFTLTATKGEDGPTVAVTAMVETVINVAARLEAEGATWLTVDYLDHGIFNGRPWEFNEVANLATYIAQAAQARNAEELAEVAYELRDAHLVDTSGPAPRGFNADEGAF